METGYYLDSFLAPLSPWLSREDVTDIWINRPGEVWIETLGGTIERVEEPALDERLLARDVGRVVEQPRAFTQRVTHERDVSLAQIPDAAMNKLCAAA